jgi:hypothetical protein
MGSAISPTYSEIMQRCRALASQRPEVVRFAEMGPSEEGRPIPMLSIGEVERDLPLMMVIGGTHGSEETGRGAAMAFGEWLAGEGIATLDGMSAVIIPCANPDGAEANTYRNAKNANLYHAYAYDAPSVAAEGRAIEGVALDLLPDCVVDVHGLAGGAMGDSEFLIPALSGGMGLQISYSVAAEIDAAAAKVGFPQRHPTVEGEFKGKAASICDKMATLTNALCLTLEITENYYPLEDSVRSGMARLTRLLEIGRRVQYNQPYPGFPCDTLSGGPMAALMASGATYRKRRENRLKTMAALIEGDNYFERSHADPGGVATITLRLDRAPATPPDGLVFQFALDPRGVVKRVGYLWPTGEEGELRAADLSDEHGWHMWRQDGIPMVRASVARQPAQGTHIVQVEYDAPFRPHVRPAWKVYSHE